MRKIEIHTWPRREQFMFLRDWDYPHFNMCANVDLTAFHPFVKQRSVSINIAIVYVLARAANAVSEFRYRIRDGEVVEHEVVHPSTTILTEGDLFSFCMIEYSQDFPTFASRAAERIAHIKQYPTLEDEPGQDNLLFMTAIPWVSFTSFMHPIDLHPVDSVPRLAWGKFFHEGDLIKMPLSVQAHHALMDGVHMGRFYTQVQDYLSHPSVVLSGGHD